MDRFFWNCNLRLPLRFQIFRQQIVRQPSVFSRNNCVDNYNQTSLKKPLLFGYDQHLSMIYNVKFFPVYHFLCLLENFWKQWQKFEPFFRYTLACNTNWMINLNWIGELCLQLKTGVFYVLSVVCCIDWLIIQSFSTIFGINFVNEFLFDFKYFTNRTRF